MISQISDHSLSLIINPVLEVIEIHTATLESSLTLSFPGLIAYKSVIAKCERLIGQLYYQFR